MIEAPSPPHISNNTTGITLQDHQVTVPDGDHDKQEMVKLEVDGGGESALVEDRCSDGVYDKPPSCFGCGIGWFSFLLGFAFPPVWYNATVLYFGNYVKDPRETWPCSICNCCFNFLSCLGCPACFTILLAASTEFLQEMQTMSAANSLS